MKFEISPATQTRPKCFSSNRRAELTSSPTERTVENPGKRSSVSCPDPGADSAVESKCVLTLLIKLVEPTHVRQCSRSSAFVHDGNESLFGHAFVMEPRPAPEMVRETAPACVPNTLIGNKKSRCEIGHDNDFTGLGTT